MIGGTAASAAAPPLFETLRWTAPGAEHAALSSQPQTCLAYDPRDQPMVLAGEALFNTPALLGGQAAKAGLNCASCHANGRDNPHFLMAGVSGDPGTADVTSSFFSPARGNGRFDPLTIPDLAEPGKIARDPATNALEPFIRALIVEEFAGPEPSPVMLEALATYVRAIRDCPGADDAPVPRRLEDQLALIHAAVAGAGETARRGDSEGTRLLIAAARHQLGMISERYAGPGLARARMLLLGASRQLQTLANDDLTPAAMANAFAGWSTRFDRIVRTRLVQNEAQSLYNPNKLGFVAPQRESR